MTDYHIQRANKDEIKIPIAWAAREGWNPGIHDAECFYQADPQGFFLGKLGDKVIATGSAVIYDDHFAFCGCYIVDENFRGQGYGLALTQARLSYIGDRNAGLDGVVNMLDKYARLGYRTAHHNIRYCGKITDSQCNNDHLHPLAEIDFAQLSAYDRKHFPAARENFLKCWIQQPEGAALGYLEHDQLRGYGVLRACQQGYKIGPLFADNEIIAQQLFAGLAAQTHGHAFYLDIPESNPYAIKLVNKYQMEMVFETARMYLHGAPELPIENIYGITTFELG